MHQINKTDLQPNDITNRLLTTVEAINIVVGVNTDNEPVDSTAVSISHPNIKCRLLVPAVSCIRVDNSVIYNELPLKLEPDIERDVKQVREQSNHFKCILKFEYSLKYDMSNAKLKITFDEARLLIDKVDATIEWRKTDVDRAIKSIHDSKEEDDVKIQTYADCLF